MSSTTAIRSGLGASLAVAFADFGFQVVPFSLHAPTPPAFQIVPDRLDYHEALQSGLEVHRFIIHGVVTVGVSTEAQASLDELMDDKPAGDIDPSVPPSVRQAIEADQYLTSRLNPDGSIDTDQPRASSDVTVKFCTGYRLYPLQGSNQLVLGAEWTIEVRT